MAAPGVDLADDTAIARLLAEDAKASSSRYASQGLSALLPRRQAGSAPKPNTRFLKALVRDTDSHNAALRRKEDRERVERLRNGGARAADRQTGHSRREKTRGEDESGRERKRRRLSNDHRITDEAEPRSRKSTSERHVKSVSRRRDRDRSRSRSISAGDDSRRRRKHHHDDRRRSKERQGSDDDAWPPRSHRKHRNRRSCSPNGDMDEGRRSRKETSPSRGKQRRRRESSSDPLEDLVGPLPAKEQSTPVRVRGRGAHKIASASNIDSHFSSSYDPSLDVNAEDEDVGEREDWDMALEALRDRQAWKSKHEDRMRAAGFGEDEIEKWKESGREKDARDVQWRKKGQVREWDVGKDHQSSDNDQNGRLTP